MDTQPDIVTIGSAILDLTYRIDHTPGPGESVHATESMFVPGGKGLLQAVAASRLGAKVTLLAAVGDDEHGASVRAAAQEAGVQVGYLATSAETTTRFNLAAVDSAGDVSFVQLHYTSPATLLPSHIATAKGVIQNADILLLTLEPPVAVLEAVLTILDEKAVHRPLCYLNPAPAHFVSEKLSDRLVAAADFFVPNYLEALAAAEHLSSHACLSDVPGNESAIVAADMLGKRGIARGCITVGGAGCVYFDGDSVCCNQGYRVEHPVDTTGASDAFIAALAISLHSGCTVEEALSDATAAGAHSVTVHGGYASMPSMGQVRMVQRMA
jgi:ribokinase